MTNTDFCKKIQQYRCLQVVPNFNYATRRNGIWPQLPGYQTDHQSSWTDWTLAQNQTLLDCWIARIFQTFSLSFRKINNCMIFHETFHEFYSSSVDCWAKNNFKYFILKLKMPLRRKNTGRKSLGHGLIFDLDGWAQWFDHDWSMHF